MRLLYILLFFLAMVPASAQGTMAYDLDQAIEICSSLPLDFIEGIWVYPEDKVTVLILKDGNVSTSALPDYSITVVDSEDTRLLPGVKIGNISATPETGKYTITLFTEKNKDLFQKAQTCTAVLSKDADALILKGNKSKKFNLRLNLNLNRLLPNFWRFVRISISGNNSSDTPTPVGLVKVFPSYDGNGSSRRQPRYL